VLALKSLAAKSFWEPRITRMGTDEDRGTQGCAWTSQAGAALSNPFASELARDSDKPFAHLATQMALLRPEIFLKNTSLRLVSKRGCVVKKHPQARLRGSFPQQLQHSRSESSPCFFCLPI
jgi:hypothetical protein